MMLRPATRARMTSIASSRVFMVVGGLPSTRRALSPRPMPRSMRPPLSSSSTPSAEAVTLGSRVAGFVTQVPRRMRWVASAITVSRTYGSRHRTWLSNSQPYANPFASARLARSMVRSTLLSGLSVKPKSIRHCLRAAAPTIEDTLTGEGLCRFAAWCGRAIGPSSAFSPDSDDSRTKPTGGAWGRPMRLSTCKRAPEGTSARFVQPSPEWGDAGRPDDTDDAAQCKNRARSAVVSGEMEGIAWVDARPRTRSDDFATAAAPHYAGLVRRLTLVVGDRETALDVAQDAYLRAFRAWDRFDGADIRAWLRTIGLRLAFNERDRRRRFLTLLRRRPVRQPWVDPEDAGLAEALAGLRREHRAALLLSV